MSLVTDIKDIEGHHLAKGLLGFLGIVAPGLLIIYHYHPNLIEKYDVAKLVLFSASITTPVFFVNLVIMVITQPRAKTTSLNVLLGMSAMGTSFVLYDALLLAYAFHFTFRTLIVAVLVGFVGFAWVAWGFQKDEKKG